MMKIFLLMTWFIFSCLVSHAKAQISQELSSVPEQWELTLDVIKSKAKTLMVKNNNLALSYRQSLGQLQELRQAIGDQEQKNQHVASILKARHNRTDQQIRLEELNQKIKQKKEQFRNLEVQAAGLKQKQKDLDAKIQALKYTLSGLELHQVAEKETIQEDTSPSKSIENQLAPWRKQLEDENRQEVLLENQLAVLKTASQKQGLSESAINSDNKQLQDRLETLRLQLVQAQSLSKTDNLAQAHARMVTTLKKRKYELELAITSYGARLDKLRENSLTALSWPLQKKKLVRLMVKIDARNNQIRQKNKQLQEDIDVLRQQVAKLERRVNFVKGADFKL